MNARQHYYLDQLGITRWELRKQAHPDRAQVSEQADHPVDKSAAIEQLDWTDLKMRVKHCQACQLSKTRTQTVFGVGNTQANLLIVGEAPGYYEDKQGEPFVGKAGQLLGAMLKAIGYKREQVFIANVLKCRPPNNRDPAPDEVKACTPFLQRQVALLQPKLILALGRHAAHYLLNTQQSLARLRCEIHRFSNTPIPLIVSYHPAYLLRNPKDKAKAYLDLLRVTEQLEPLATDELGCLS